MNLRVKRLKETYFVPVQRHSSFISIKETISKICGVNEITKENMVNVSDITLYKPPYSTDVTQMKELPDNGTVSDHEVPNDSVLYAVFGSEKIDVEGETEEGGEAKE